MSKSSYFAAACILLLCIGARVVLSTTHHSSNPLSATQLVALVAGNSPVNSENRAGMHEGQVV